MAKTRGKGIDVMFDPFTNSGLIVKKEFLKKVMRNDPVAIAFLTKLKEEDGLTIRNATMLSVSNAREIMKINPNFFTNLPVVFQTCRCRFFFLPSQPTRPAGGRNIIPHRPAICQEKM